ncbi:hypothetical protein A3C23_00195 [Candidatus Roizmanbacteria bacterium RIFCSPHIGHO2_02_FULL_37_13b]|nr:MAG: hypothetical protein A3C23_00195 [Candidatus Roizmanbacteria bacterium RIFCSPHIGHO2_02_FULL_37_13b]
MKRLAVLISTGGTGTNLQAIINAIEKGELKAKIVVVLSDSSDALGLERARKHEIPYEIVDKNTDLVAILKKQYQVDYICLAGWKLIIPDSFIDSFENKILNIHPGLIPDSLSSRVKNPDGSKALWNRGKFTDKAIQNFLDSGASYAGSTVHFLSHDFDFGPILGRVFMKIESNDTVDSLYSRLKHKEHELYINVLKKLCK